MDTRQVDDFRGVALKQSMDALLENPRQLPAGFHAATVVAGVGMLVEPFNSAPYVFVPPKTVHEFTYERGSGTDHLRQRMLAGVFFNSMVAEYERHAAKDPAVGAIRRLQASPRP
ncbi:hypothetical protein ABIC83_002544 [Roseateles asaccharophilus]|uniref:hypothetical protein n=1 Tax=Roseateles asaccharophilus TaxID=582607 RepID=UPI003834A9E2